MTMVGVPADNPAAAWSVEPFREGSAEDHARLRRALAAVGYTAEALAERFAEGDGNGALAAHQGRTRPAGDDALGTLVQLFLDTAVVPRAHARERLGAELVEALEALGLLLPAPGEADAVLAPVLLYPVEGLWIVSDANLNPGEPGSAPPADAVYPAITANTLRFLELLPRDPCGDFLELCSGTGVAALLAARDFARHAWAVDVTARATRFARFNAALNGIENFTALEGDLWAPVAGRTFDRIVAHPPYVPATETVYVFRDGGEDGEQITRRVIEGLPAHLAPGGDCHCDCMASDRRDAPLERRLRAMLGAAEAEFDVVVGAMRIHDPLAFQAARAGSRAATWDEAERGFAAFQRLEVERLVVGSLRLRRHAAPARALTLRRQMHSLTRAGDLDWLLRWHALALAPAALLDERPAAVPWVEARLVERRAGASWALASCTITIAVPFPAEGEVPPWVRAVLARCDGRATGREVLRAVRDAGEAPVELDEARFATLLHHLASTGFVSVGACPLPARRWPPA